MSDDEAAYVRKLETALREIAEMNMHPCGRHTIVARKALGLDVKIPPNSFVCPAILRSDHDAIDR